MPAFRTLRHVITDIKGSMISVKNEEGKDFSRDAARFERLIAPPSYIKSPTAIQASATAVTIPELRRRSIIRRQT
jgi:hypothetical protein